MGRFYSVPFKDVAVSVAQDLFEIKVATGKPLTLHEIVVEQSSDFGDAQAEGLGIVIKRGTSGVMSGSGGTAPTPAKHNTSDAAASATAEVNNTTQASNGTGTITTIRAEAFNVQMGYRYQPIPQQRIVFEPGEYCIVSLTAPADALTMSGTLVFEED